MTGQNEVEITHLITFNNFETPHSLQKYIPSVFTLFKRHFFVEVRHNQ